MTDDLTLEQAAELAGYASTASLRHAIGRNSLTAHYEVVNGRAVHMVRREDLERFLANRRTHNQDGRRVPPDRAGCLGTRGGVETSL